MRVLLDILHDGQFHSGQDLGRALGVSRSAIWKKLQKLEGELGLTVHAVKGRGYRLAAPISLLSSASALESAAGCPVRILDSVDSTNLEAMRLLASGIRAPFGLFAERQSAGRGRRGREWISPFAENIYYSSVVRVDGGARLLEALPLSVGLAVHSTLAGYGLQGLGLKWPNDILVGGQKIAGILLEVSGDPADQCYVIIGVGVNVNMRTADAITQPWTSLALQLGGQLMDRNAFAEKLCGQISAYLQRHFESGFTSLRAEWEQHHLWLGRQAVLSMGNRQVEGVIAGVGEDGSLQLEIDEAIHSFSGGELSLRLADDS